MLISVPQMIKPMKQVTDAMMHSTMHVVRQHLLFFFAATMLRIPTTTTKMPQKIPGPLAITAAITAANSKMNMKTPTATWAMPKRR